MSHYKITWDRDSNGNDVLRYTGDAQGIVDHCADYARDLRDHGQPKDNELGLRKVMSVDPVVMMEICRQTGMDYFNPDLINVLKGRDYSRFHCSNDKRYYKSSRSKIVSLGKK